MLMAADDGCMECAMATYTHKILVRGGWDESINCWNRFALHHTYLPQHVAAVADPPIAVESCCCCCPVEAVAKRAPSHTVAAGERVSSPQTLQNSKKVDVLPITETN